ncbi:hypothetical protein Tco_1377187 [Tanacetum coccineum]
MADENVLALAPTRSDDQILPFAAWVPIGKSNYVLDLQKKQKNLIFQISVDILQNTNFFRAFTASASVPAIYIQQFWNTLTYEAKTGAYSFQLDETRFVLDAIIYMVSGGLRLGREGAAGQYYGSIRYHLSLTVLTIRSMEQATVIDSDSVQLKRIGSLGHRTGKMMRYVSCIEHHILVHNYTGQRITCAHTRRMREICALVANVISPEGVSDSTSQIATRAHETQSQIWRSSTSELYTEQRRPRLLWGGVEVWNERYGEMFEDTRLLSILEFILLVRYSMRDEGLMDGGIVSLFALSEAHMSSGMWTRDINRGKVNLETGVQGEHVYHESAEHKSEMMLILSLYRGLCDRGLNRERDGEPQGSGAEVWEKLRGDKSSINGFTDSGYYSSCLIYGDLEDLSFVVVDISMYTHGQFFWTVEDNLLSQEIERLREKRDWGGETDDRESTKIVVELLWVVNWHSGG